MPSDWITLTVEDLIAQKILAVPIDGNHGAIHPKASDFVPVGVPFIMASDMIGGQVDLQGCAYITPEQAGRLRKGFARTGDVLLSHKATIGRTALLQVSDNEFVVLTPQVTYYRVQDYKRLNNRFLKYYFDAPFFQQILATWAGAGSTRAYLGITAQRKLPILLPPIEEQESIAFILGALDDKIALLRETNATLEAIAQTVFKSWFVDFDPVRAKAEGRDPEGVPPGVADMLPSEFEDSELGTIPKWWKVRKWGDIIRLEYGKALRDYRVSTGRIPVYGTNGPIGFHAEPHCNHAGIVVGRKGAYRGIHFAPEPFCVIDTAFFMEGREDLSWRWAYYEALRFNLNAMDSGSAIPSTDRNLFYRIPVCTPPLPIQRAFENLLASSWEKQVSNEREMNTLANLRDTLLPRLMSGKLITHLGPAVTR